MAKGGCVNGGDLVTTSYSTPVPWIGLYIAAATLVCFIFMTLDFLHGLIRRKAFLPCKWFQMNALTLTLLQVVTKIPVDLTASMPRAEDQLSKLTSTALLCTSLGFYMPSLGTMGKSERYSNMVALSMMVITVVVNVCIQMRTGPIFAFTAEHIIIIVCMLVLLLVMWSSAIAITAQLKFAKNLGKLITGEVTSNVKDVQRLGELLKNVHVLNYTGNPQSLLCETWHHHAFGLLCVLSFLVVIQATLRSVVFKTMRFCIGSDDYQWSIPFVIVTQLLTIGVGTCSIIYRWYSLIRHTDFNVLFTYNWLDSFVDGELANLKLKTLSFWVFEKNISAVIQVPKDIIIELLIRTQVLLYGCSKWLIGLPIYGVKMFFGFIIAFFHSRQHDDEIQGVSREWVISSLGGHLIFNKWITGMATKEFQRWTKKYNKRWTEQKNDDQRIDCQTPLENPIIPLISKWQASKSECFVLGGILERLYKVVTRLETNAEVELFGFKIEEYRVSCLSVLVLSRMLKELMPSSSSNRWREFLEESSKALDESFDIIYYVDHKTLGDQKRLPTSIVGTQNRLSLAKSVWANWKNPKHWFHEIILDACTLPMNSENSSNYSDQLHHAREVLKHARHAVGRYIANDLWKNEKQFIVSQKLLILYEIPILCKLILKKKHESIEDLFDFLEMSFVKMLRLTLSALPKAILKEIQGDYPYGICEGNAKEALKFFCALKSLENNIEWSWEDEFLSVSQENDVESFVDAPDSSSEDEGEAPPTRPITVILIPSGRPVLPGSLRIP